MQSARNSPSHADLLALLPDIQVAARRLMRPVARFRDQHDVRDLEQDAFLAILQAHPRFDGSTQLQTFHRLRISGAMIDGLRRWDRKRGGTTRIEWTQLPETAAAIYSDDRHVAADRLVFHAEVRDAVKRLPDREIEILDRYYRDGETQQTIARAMGISESLVGVLRHKSLRTLRERLT